MGSLVAAYGLLSSCGTRAPERVGSVFCGTLALWLRHATSVLATCGLSCPVACGILVPRTGIEPASPALEGRFFTTGPPGKSLHRSLKTPHQTRYPSMVRRLQIENLLEAEAPRKRDRKVFPVHICCGRPMGLGRGITWVFTPLSPGTK